MSDPSEPLSDEWFDNLVAKMPYDDGGVGAVVRAVAAAALRWALDEMDRQRARSPVYWEAVLESRSAIRARADAIEGER